MTPGSYCFTRCIALVEKPLPKTQLPPKGYRTPVKCSHQYVTEFRPFFFFFRVQKIPKEILNAAHNWINYSHFLSQKDLEKI